MLKKCFKYDFRNFLKIWLILSGILISVSVPAGLGIGRLIRDTANGEANLFFVLYIILFMTFYFGIVAYPVGTTILMCVRYYTHFFSDQGYLTFTLPVKRSTLFFSKLLTSVLYSIMSFGVMLTSVITVVTCAGGMAETIPELWWIVVDLWNFGGINLILWIPLSLICLVLLSCVSYLFTYLCITLGSVIFKKLKFLAAIGIYYVFNSFISPIFMYVGIFALSTMSAAAFEAFSAELLIARAPYVVTLGFIVAICMLASVALALIGIILHCLERKLNLA